MNATQHNMNQSTIEDAVAYAWTLNGLPFRWYVNGEMETFSGDNAFWCENSPPPSAEEIRVQDKYIVCTGLPNLMRRFCGLTIPGLGPKIRGKYGDLYKQYPGGTTAWFAYLYQNKRVQKFDIKARYPRGTLLMARYKAKDFGEKDQGHLAVVYDDVDETKTIKDQQIIHSTPTTDYKNRDSCKDHGSVKIESFNISNELFKWDKVSYYKWVCLPEDWLLLD
jgi:hypothetical protein